MVFRLVKRFNGKAGEHQPAGLTNQRLESRNLAVVLAVSKADLLHGQFAAPRLRYNGLGQRMVER